MAIFISYRRADTQFWADRLFETLARRFGIRFVFMDINGGIRRGANFPERITEAVNSCNALLALMGPEWVTIRGADGNRRIDQAGDWVRKEIATALGRKIPVFPVLLGNAKLPAANDLPEPLHPLLEKNAALVRDTDWHSDVAALVADIAAQTGMAAADDDVFAAAQGLGLVRNLVARFPDVRAAVGLSRAVFENAHEQTEKLKVSKDIHDALHTIEFDCLRQLRPERTIGLRTYKMTFDLQRSFIERALDSATLNERLREDIRDYLGDAALALQAAIDQPSAESVATAIGALNALISALPPRLDERIADAVNALDLERVVALMTLVRNRAAEEASDLASCPELAGLLNAMQAFARLNEDLKKKKTEHSRLQRLDTKLRTVCIGASAPASEWPRIKNLVRDLAPPCSEPVEAIREDLTQLQTEIDAAMAQGQFENAFDLLNEYFRAIGSVFRVVDTDLKQWCLNLGGVSQPLENLLSTL
jgi:hypothetical protein